MTLPKVKKEIPDIRTIEALEYEWSKVYLIKDKGVIRIFTGSIIANRMGFDTPVWLMLVSASGGGKTELLHAFSSLNFMHPISTLTVNTFASGMKIDGKETSLLHKINNGIMVFKDFTSILSINKDAKKEIMAQMREIFDGSFVKRTGNGKDTKWQGKIGAIAATTELIYDRLEDMSAMGERFIMYNMVQPDRKETARRVLANAFDMEEKRDYIQRCTESYVNYVLKNMPKEDINLSEETKEKLLTIADFATQVRSAVVTDFKTGMPTFVPSPEMPTRVTQQLYMLASALVAMDRCRPAMGENTPAQKGELTDFDLGLLSKVALDSIPKKRRMALQKLAKYKNGVTTAGMAVALDYSTEVVKLWLYQLNSLGILKRQKKGGSKGDKWVMKDEFIDIMQKFDQIESVDEVLESGDEDDDDYNPDEKDEIVKPTNEKEKDDIIYKDNEVDNFDF